MKKSEAIITSLLDTDLYKLSMQNAVRQEAPNVNVRYKFVCRTANANQGLVEYVLPRLREQVDHLCSLKFRESELKWLGGNVPFLPSSFVDFSLRGFQLLSSCVKFGTDEEGRFFLDICGPWYDTILFEVPLLAIIEELYMDYQVSQHPEIEDHLLRTLDAKVTWLKRLLFHGGWKLQRDLSITEMGTRRRRSKEWQKNVVQRFDEEFTWKIFTGTSNIKLAQDLKLRVFGTMAHEWVQGFQGLSRFDRSQKHALNAWQRVYGGGLGIALTDTLGADMFLQDFDSHLANAFTGVRNDSGDPIAWGRKMLEHYRALKISTATKTLVFSNALDFERMQKILLAFPQEPEEGEGVKCGFGIGTYLTNDSTIDGVQRRADIVIKMVECDGHPVIKISDDPGKTICTSEAYKAYAEEQIARRLGK